MEWVFVDISGLPNIQTFTIQIRKEFYKKSPRMKLMLLGLLFLSLLSKPHAQLYGVRYVVTAFLGMGWKKCYIIFRPFRTVL